MGQTEAQRPSAKKGTDGGRTVSPPSPQVPHLRTEPITDGKCLGGKNSRNSKKQNLICHMLLTVYIAFTVYL